MKIHFGFLPLIISLIKKRLTMDKKKFTIVLFVLLFAAFFPHNLNAQFNDYAIKFGLQGNGILTDTEFDNDLKADDADFKLSFLQRLFMRFELFTEAIEAEIGGGYGILNGVDVNNQEWRTHIIPIDVRLIISPFDFKVWDPYLYGGFGALNYNIDRKPGISSPNTADLKEKEWTTFAPFGIGIDFAVADNALFTVSGGYSLSFTDNLNYYNNDETNDGYYSAGIGVMIVTGWGGSDHDGDGLTAREEEELGTDPEIADTDGDGLKDGEEVNTHMTDPKNSDSDNDGLTDNEEINKYRTSAVNKDSDSDGLNDGDEVKTHKTDPLKSDTDDDALNDYDEIMKIKSDPVKPDTDNDTLKDGEEVNTYKTSPVNSDTDGDKLKDADEIRLHKTDPLKADTDNGTVNDGVEINRGTDPLNADDDIVKMEVPIVLEGITFESGKADITPETEQILAQALKTLQTYPEIVVEIGGYTDDVGSASANKKLSQKRADSVRSWLISKGVDSGRIVAVGYGEEKPRVANDSPDNRRLNRRIEFKRIK